MTWRPNADRGDWLHLAQTGNEIQLENLRVTQEGDYLGKRFKMDITPHYRQIFEQARLWRAGILGIRYPGDDGTEPEDVREEKAQAYARSVQE